MRALQAFYVLQLLLLLGVLPELKKVRKHCASPTRHGFSISVLISQKNWSSIKKKILPGYSSMKLLHIIIIEFFKYPLSWTLATLLEGVGHKKLKVNWNNVLNYFLVEYKPPLIH